MANCSVLILTLNEEDNLPRCLEALRWCDDIVVLDSYSSDRTVQIAEQAGCRVVQRAFDNWSAHQNFAVETIPFKYPWVYYIDADEIMTPELADEVQRVAADPDRREVSFRVRRKDMFFGQWIKRSSLYPTWLFRLFKPQHIRWERLTHVRAVVDGPWGDLAGHMIHYSFSKGINAWVVKHTQYAVHEAMETLASRGTSIAWSELFSGDAMRRRKTMKSIATRMPFRPLLRFLYMYVVRRGFLDGRAGWTYCRLIGYYEYLTILNVRELERRQRGLPL